MSALRFLGTTDAAKLAGVTSRTMQRWAKQYGLGKKIGGHFRIDPNELQSFLNGDHPHTSIGARSGEIVQ